MFLLVLISVIIGLFYTPSYWSYKHKPIARLSKHTVLCQLYTIEYIHQSGKTI